MGFLALTVNKNAIPLVWAATSLLVLAIKDVTPDGQEITVNLVNQRFV